MNPYAIEVMRELGVDLTSHTLQVRADDRSGDGRHRRHALRGRGLPGLSRQGAAAALADSEPASSDPSLSREQILTRFRAARDQIRGRIEVLAELLDLPEGPRPRRVPREHSRAQSSQEHAFLLLAPRSGAEGVDASILDLRSARAAHELRARRVRREGAAPRHALSPRYWRRGQGRGHPCVRAREGGGRGVEKPPRTTWRGTPLHELWLEDPDGNLVEVYARLTPKELATKPKTSNPLYWCRRGTRPHPVSISRR